MQAPVGHIAFGPFCLNIEAPRLLRDGVELELRPQALYALTTLVQNSGRCVAYEDMISAAWHGICVSRHTVAVTVGEVKKALELLLKDEILNRRVAIAVISLLVSSG